MAQGATPQPREWDREKEGGRRQKLESKEFGMVGENTTGCCFCYLQTLWTLDLQGNRAKPRFTGDSGKQSSIPCGKG